MSETRKLTAILVADAVRVRQRLDLKAADLGPQNVKNIAEPVHVYSLEVGPPAQAKPPAPRRTSAAHPAFRRP
jgi:adenylate cyclase